MLNFMDYVQNAFNEATGWNKDNSYGALTATSRNLLDFELPEGLRFHVSSLSSPNFASSYTLGSIGLVDGSLSYLYSSHELQNLISHSSILNLRDLVPGYHQLQDLRQPDEPDWWEIWQRGRRIDKRGTLLYGRLFLPKSTLEALYVRRLTPRSQVRVSCVSDARLPHGGTILAHLQHDAAKYSTEYIYSTDSALLGVRGLYNFGPDPLPNLPSPTAASIPLEDRSIDPTVELANEAAESIKTRSILSPIPRPHGRLSLGGELYYGILNKSGGISTGLRFTTLPSHTGFPYTMTVTMNPLMGNLSSTYSVLASPMWALSSRFDFNVYSYESEVTVGMELWRRKRRRRKVAGPEDVPAGDVNWARIKMGMEPLPLPSPLDLSISTENSGGGDSSDDPVSGCLKARVDQRGGVEMLWEGRIKELLYTCGVSVDMKGGENMFRGIGIEVSYSS